jgi:GNAT superfamily N-acetyltransferase
MTEMTEVEYALEPLDALPPQTVAAVREIYEDGFAEHQRAEFAELTDHRQEGEFGLVLVRHGRRADGPCGFAMLRPLGRTGMVFLRYFVVDGRERGQGLGGIMWDRLTARLRADGFGLLVFDVDDPDEPGHGPDEVSIRSRRISFYERHGARLLPVCGYRTPHVAEHGQDDTGLDDPSPDDTGPDWTPMLLMTADLSGDPGDPDAPRRRSADRRTRAVVDAVYRYRWQLDPGHSQLARVLIDSQ